MVGLVFTMVFDWCAAFCGFLGFIVFRCRLAYYPSFIYPFAFRISPWIGPYYEVPSNSENISAKLMVFRGKLKLDSDLIKESSILFLLKPSTVVGRMCATSVTESSFYSITGSAEYGHFTLC